MPTTYEPGWEQWCELSDMEYEPDGCPSCGERDLEDCSCCVCCGEPDSIAADSNGDPICGRCYTAYGCGSSDSHNNGGTP
jgi:hypothetical protein